MEKQYEEVRSDVANWHLRYFTSNKHGAILSDMGRGLERFCACERRPKGRTRSRGIDMWRGKSKGVGAGEVTGRLADTRQGHGQGGKARGWGKE